MAGRVSPCHTRDAPRREPSAPPYVQERASTAANTPLLSLLAQHHHGTRGNKREPPVPHPAPLSWQDHRVPGELKTQTHVAGEDSFFIRGDRETHSTHRMHGQAVSDGRTDGVPLIDLLTASSTRAATHTDMVKALQPAKAATGQSEERQRAKPDAPLTHAPVTPVPSSGNGTEENEEFGAPCGRCHDDGNGGGVLFRQRLGETERRFKEQLAVHRALTAALHDIDRVQADVRALKSEEQLTRMLALLRVRQDEAFGRVSADTPFPASCPVAGTAPSTVASPGSGGTYPTHSPSTARPPAHTTPIPTTPVGTAAASPLRDILEAFSKPRVRSGIPSPPPIGAGAQQQQQHSSSVTGSIGRAGRSNRQSGGSSASPYRGLDVVNLQTVNPTPYVQIRWVPRYSSADGEANVPSVVVEESGDSQVPHIDETHANIHDALSIGSSTGDGVYEDDFEEEVPDDGDEDVVEDEVRTGSTTRSGNMTSIGILTESSADDAESGKGTKARARSRSSKADAGSTFVDSSSSAALSVDTNSVSTLPSGDATDTTSVEAAGGKARRRKTSSKRTPRTSQTRSVLNGKLMEALSAFYTACRSANRAAETLAGYSALGVDDKSADSSKDGVNASDKHAEAGEWKRGRKKQRGLAEGRGGAERLVGAYDDIQRLRHFNDRLATSLCALDLERRARRAKGKLLAQAQALARARRALTEEEEAILEEVLPRGVAAKLLASRRVGATSLGAAVVKSDSTRKYRTSGGVAGKEERSRRTTKRGGYRREGADASSITTDVLTDVSLSEQEASDMLYFSSKDHHRGSAAKKRRGAVEDTVEEEDGLDVSDTIEESGAIQSDYGSVPSEVTTDAAIEDVEDVEDVYESLSNSASRLSSITEVSENTEEEDVYTDILDDSDGSTARSVVRRGSSNSTADNDVPEDLDELEEAIQRAIDEHAIEHVFRRGRRRPSVQARGRTRTGREGSFRNSALSDTIEEIEEENGDGDVQSSILNSHEKHLADRLAANSSLSVSELLTDTSVQNDVRELPSLDHEPSIIEEEESDADDLRSSPTSSSSYPESQEGPPEASTSASAADSSNRSSRIGEENRSTAVARSPPTTPSSSNSAEPLDGSTSNSDELGEAELRALEADIRDTRHRRRTALRRVLVKVSPSCQKPNSPTDEADADVPTFTQLYDPLDSTFTTTDEEKGVGDDFDEPPALRRRSHSLAEGEATGDVLVRLRTLRDTATAEKRRGKRVLFVEADLLRSRDSCVAARTQEAVTAAFPQETKETQTEEVEGEQQYHPVSAQSGDDVTSLPLVVADDALAETEAKPCEVQAPRQPPKRASTLPNLCEDFVALSAWKEKQFALIKELRDHSVLVHSDSPVGESHKPAPLTAAAAAQEEALEESDVVASAFAYHWGRLNSLVETGFGQGTHWHTGDPSFTHDLLEDMDNGTDSDDPPSYHCPSLTDYELTVDAFAGEERRGPSDSGTNSLLATAESVSRDADRSSSLPSDEETV